MKYNTILKKTALSCFEQATDYNSEEKDNTNRNN